MQQRDQPETAEAEENEQSEQTLDSSELTPAQENNEMSVEEEQSLSSTEDKKKLNDRIDWLALGLVVAIAAFFAATARFNSQPSPSFVPAAALSATGCGLLVTALRKLRTTTGAGLFEAALGGAFLTLFQFAVALTYPGVLTNIMSTPVDGHAFLLTWALICLFTIVLSIAGAALGHLAFAPLRPSSPRINKRNTEDEEDNDIEIPSNPASEYSTIDTEDSDNDIEIPSNPASEYSTTNTEDSDDGIEADSNPAIEHAITDSNDLDTDTAEETEEEEEDPESSQAVVARAGSSRTLTSYVITIALFGFLPMMTGYVFAALYDFTMNLIHADQISPGLYPTLSLLSGLLPWRLAAPIVLTGTNGQFIVFTLLWRIPDSFLGNPNTFDVQTLEPLLFNAAALALLLVTMYQRESKESKPQSAPWRRFILLELLLGLFLILPADLWMLQGLEGVLSFEGSDIALPTIHFLNTTMFILNLLTGPLFCLLIALVVRRQYQLWNLPRRASTNQAETSHKEV